MGTAAHSWVMSFESETEAFARTPDNCSATRPCSSSILTIRSKARALRRRLGRPLWGVRIDSGDLFRLSREVRRILDDAGLQRRQESWPAAIWTKSASPQSWQMARPSTHSASARNWRLRPTRHPWAPSTNWSRCRHGGRDPLHREEQPGQAHPARRQAVVPLSGT